MMLRSYTALCFLRFSPAGGETVQIGHDGWQPDKPGAAKRAGALQVGRPDPVRLDELIVGGATQPSVLASSAGGETDPLGGVCLIASSRGVRWRFG